MQRGDQISKIFLHAITSSVTLKTMRLKGRINNHELIVLIDSGSTSTHNFIDLEIVERAQVQVDVPHKLAVTVANGDRVKSEGKFPNVKIKLQGNVFDIEAFVLVIGRSDMVLRIHWLKTLGLILWNFSDLTMQFKIG